MGADATSALIGPILGWPWLLGYSIPALLFAAVAPAVLSMYGARGLWFSWLTMAAVAGAALSEFGGQYRRAAGTGGPELIGAVVAAIAIAVILAVPALVVQRSARGGAARATQVRSALIAAIATVAIASPVLFLVVSCAVSGECL